MYDSLSNDDLVKLLGELDPKSEEYLPALNEASARNIEEVHWGLVRFLSAEDVYLNDLAELYLSFWGRKVDSDCFVELSCGYDERLLAGLLRLAMRRQPDADIGVMDAIESQFDGFVFCSLVLCLAVVEPSNAERTAAFLIKTVSDSRLTPVCRRKIYARLASLPRTPEIGNFFVDALIRYDGNYPELAEIANRALEQG